MPPQAGPQEIFQQNCKLCHGEDGRGKTKQGIKYKSPDFTSPRWQKHTTDDEIRSAIEDGVPKTKMKGFKDKLTSEQIEALARYVRAFGKSK
jgi:mono/diheme cytochrome c family protein